VSQQPPRNAYVENESHLVWVDMEMSGLEPDRDRILEVAMVVTDKDLNLIAEGPVLVVHQSDAVLDAMDNWNKGTHGKSGLVDKVKASTLGDAEVEAQMLAFMKQHVGAHDADVRQLDLSGSSFHGALYAGAGGLFPLPQPGCVDLEGTRQARTTTSSHTSAPSSGCTRASRSTPAASASSPATTARLPATSAFPSSASACCTTTATSPRPSTATATRSRRSCPLISATCRSSR
jgi:hypothetical protein